MGEGSLARRPAPPAIDWADYIRMGEQEKENSRLSALRALLGFPFFLVVLLCASFIQHLRHNLVVTRSKFPSSEDTRPAADE